MSINKLEKLEQNLIIFSECYETIILLAFNGKNSDKERVDLVHPVYLDIWNKYSKNIIFPLIFNMSNISKFLYFSYILIYESFIESAFNMANTEYEIKHDRNKINNEKRYDINILRQNGKFNTNVLDDFQKWQEIRNYFCHQNKNFSKKFSPKYFDYLFDMYKWCEHNLKHISTYSSNFTFIKENLEIFEILKDLISSPLDSEMTNIDKIIELIIYSKFLKIEKEATKELIQMFEDDEDNYSQVDYSEYENLIDFYICFSNENKKPKTYERLFSYCEKILDNIKREFKI